MLEATTRPPMRTLKKDRVILYMLNSKRNIAKEKKIQKLLTDVLKTIE